MNILIVTQYFWPENFRINDLAVGLKEKGHSVTVLTGIPNYPEGHFALGYGVFKKKTEDYHEVKIVRVPLVSRGNSKGLRLALNYFSYAFFASILGPLYCRGKFDVIFVIQLSPVTVGIPAIVLKKIKKIPLVLWVLDLWPESLSATEAVRSKKILSMVSSLVRFLYQRCDRILAASRGFIPRIVATGGDPKLIEYFPNWSESLYNPITTQTTAPDYCALPKGFRIMFAGNIGAAQSFDTILSAAQKLRNYPDIKWLILGDGRMFDWVKQHVEQKGLSNTIYLLGRKPMAAMPEYFSLADVMLVTLKRDPIFALTIPGKIQSYMACAKPIIASLDGEGARLIEESGAGLFCPAEDADALAAAVICMYRMTGADRERMGRNARAYCETNFDRATLIENLEKWMEEVVTLSKKPYERSVCSWLM